MAKLSILAGATSQSVNIFIQNSASTTGAGLTGLVFNTSSLIAYYTFVGTNAAATAITLATLAAVNSAYSSGGFKEIDSTNMPGVYRLDLPNAAIVAAKGRSVIIYLQGAAGMAPCVLEIELTGWDNQDAVHGGMSALPNTACTTNASLLTSGTGTDQISNTSGRVDLGKALGTAVTLDANNVLNVSMKYLGGTLQTARDIGLSVLLSAGAGTGQLDFTAGVVKSNLVQILGTALTETAGQIAAAFKKLFDVALPVFTATSVNQTGDSFARLGAPAGASVSADVAAVKTDTAAVKTQTDKLTFTVANQVDSNVLDWKSATAPAMPTNFASLSIDGSGRVTLVPGQLQLKKNTQITITFPMTDATTHAPKTGLTVTAQRSIDGAAIGACANAVTELTLGVYSLVLAAADVNGAMITLVLSSAGADTRFIGIVTQA